jgi:hypothetical protein
VAVDVVHHRLRRGDRRGLHRRDGPPRPAAVGVPLRLLLDSTGATSSGTRARSPTRAACWSA